jgi:hypothetical protein
MPVQELDLFQAAVILPAELRALAPAFAMRPVANSNGSSFYLVTRRRKRPNGTSDAGRSSEKPLMIDFESRP